MPARITALEPLGGKSERVAVYLDGERALVLPAEVAAGLILGQELSPAEVALLTEESFFAWAYEKAVGFIGYRPRSTWEVERYLECRGADAKTVRAVVERLEAAGLLDDRAFARLWVGDRESFKPRGRRALRWELARRGVAAEAIAQALEGLDEEESAYRAGRARLERFRGLEWEDFRARLGGFLSRRGFAYPAIEAALRRLWGEREPLAMKKGEES